MKQTINLSQFRDAFNRMDRGNQFSYEGLEHIYNYFEECDPDWELDVIAICFELCEMTEMEIRNSYGLENSDSSTQYLNDNTLVLGATDTTVVFQSF